MVSYLVLRVYSQSKLGFPQRVLSMCGLFPGSITIKHDFLAQYLPQSSTRGRDSNLLAVWGGNGQKTVESPLL